MVEAWEGASPLEIEGGVLLVWLVLSM